MSKKQKLRQQKIIEFGWMNVFLLIISGGLLFVGINRFFFGESYFAVNARYLQSVVVNGGLEMLIGIILLMCLVYRLIKRKKVINQLLEMD